jgi:hypothetical protein
MTIEGNYSMTLDIVKTDDLRRGAVRIGPQQDPHRGPDVVDSPDHPLDVPQSQLTRRPFLWPQHHRHQLPAYPRIDVNREITVLVAESAEESYLLMNMSHIFGFFDVRNDSERPSPMRVDGNVNQDIGDEIKIYSRDGRLANEAMSGSLLQAIFRAGSCRSFAAPLASS